MLILCNWSKWRIWPYYLIWPRSLQEARHTFVNDSANRFSLSSNEAKKWLSYNQLLKFLIFRQPNYNWQWTNFGEHWSVADQSRLSDSFRGSATLPTIPRTPALQAILSRGRMGLRGTSVLLSVRSDGVRSSAVLGVHPFWDDRTFQDGLDQGVLSSVR